MQLTLAQIQTGRFQTAAGFCTTSPEFFELVNDAVAELNSRGDWPGSLIPIRVLMSRGCVTWPRYVGQVRAMHDCHGVRVQMHNVWYDFLDTKNETQVLGRGQENGPYSGWGGWRGAEQKMVAQFRAPCFNDIYGPNCTVRIYPMVPQDVGAQVTIFGTDNYGQPLRTNNGDGTWTDGVKITAAIPFGSTNTFVSHIDRVVKPVTQGTLNMFAYDSVLNQLWPLGAYEAFETNPNYLRYQLQGQNVPHGTGGGCGGGGCPETIIALVKIALPPVAIPTDLVGINNRRALFLAIKALKAEEADRDGTGLWKQAIESLNRNLEDDSPEDQFSVSNEVFGPGRIRRNQTF